MVATIVQTDRGNHIAAVEEEESRIVESYGYFSRKFCIRAMSLSEVQDSYLPLRYDVLHDEFAYDYGRATCPRDFWDRYDDGSRHFGIFLHSSELVGAARLIVPDASGPFCLPTDPFVQDALAGIGCKGVLGEISRVIVQAPFRRCGLFKALLSSTLISALDASIDGVLISEKACPNYTRTLRVFGFRQITASYRWSDEIIAPDVDSTTHMLSLHQAKRYELPYLWKQMQIETLNKAESRLWPDHS